MAFFGKITIPDGSFFGESIDVSEYKINITAWDDDIGKSLLNELKKPLSSFNRNLGNYYDIINKLSKINPDDYKYESIASLIEKKRVKL